MYAPVFPCASREPANAAKRVWYLRIAPRSYVVIDNVGIRAEKPFDQIAIIVEHEHNRFQAAPSELTDFLNPDRAVSRLSHWRRPR